MNRIAATLLFVGIPLLLFGQAAPDWLDVDFRRMKYPESTYFTGFAFGEISGGKSLQDITQQMKTDAQADLSRKIRMQITARSQSEIAATSSNGRYSETESFINRSATESSAEVVGAKTETYYDAKSRIVYAFAYVNRYELTGYHKGNLTVNLMQVESLLQTAKNLEADGEKSKARQQCEAAKPLLAKVRSAQEMLVALDGNISPDDLQQAKTETLHNRLAQSLAQLAQAVIVFMECSENNFSKPTSLVCNRLKSALSGKGCSFADNPDRADFKIKISAATRLHGEDRGFTTCYADVTVDLFDVRKNRNVYQDEFSQKGVASSQDAAGRKALEEAVQAVVKKVEEWIN
jgi:hypothetical protein